MLRVRIFFNNIMDIMYDGNPYYDLKVLYGDAKLGRKVVANIF